MVANPFEMSTGRLDDVDVVITDAWFEHDDELGDKTGNDLFLKLKVQAMLDDGPEERDLHMKVGNAWTTRDKGVSAVRQDDTDTTFNENSAAGIFVTSVMKHGGAEDVAARYEADPTMEPRQSKWYKGMAFHLGSLTFPARDEFQAYGRSIVAGPQTIAGQSMGEDTPNGWQGYVGEGGSPAPAPATGPGVSKGAAEKAAPAAAPAAKGPAAKGAAAPAPSEGGVDAETLAMADAIADAVGTHDQFMERAYAEIPMDKMTPELEALIKDGERTDGVWMRAVQRYNEANPS
jgi:hypothetical protein